MGKIVTLAKFCKRSMTDLEAIKVANKAGVQIHSLREFNRRLLETNTYMREKDIYPAYSSKFVILEAKDKKIDKSGIIEKTYSIDGIRRVVNLYDLGLSKYIGEKNITFFVDQNPDIGNGKPNLEIVQDGNNAEVRVNDHSTIVAIKNMPRNGEQLSPYDYECLIGVTPTDITFLNFFLSDGANIRLLSRGYDNFCFYGHLVGGYDWLGRFGVQGEQTGVQAPDAKILAEQATRK